MRYGIAGRTLGTLALVLGAGSAVAQSPVSVSGVGYAQYMYQFGDTANHANAFDVTRAYLNAIGKFGDVTTRVTGDIYRNTDNSLAYRLKYAYAAYTPPNSSLTYKLGLIHTPFIDWEESLWGYRMQGSTALDRNKYMTSADFGFGVDGKWNNDQVNMQVGFYNGEGYSGGTGDQRKDVMGRVSFRLYQTDDSSKVGGLRVTGYAQYGKPTGGGERQRYLGMLSYKSKMYTLAAEYAMTRDSNTVTPLAETDGRVMSFFGVVNIPQSRAAVIGRVDVVDPNTDTANNRQTRFIGGVSYRVSPNLRVLADIDAVSYEGGTPSPAAQATKTTGLFQVELAF